MSSYGRAFVKPKKQAPRGEFKGAFPSKPSGASAFTSEYRGAYEPVKGVKAAPAPIVSAKEDVPQYGDYHSTARDEMRRSSCPARRRCSSSPRGVCRRDPRLRPPPKRVRAALRLLFQVGPTPRS